VSETPMGSGPPEANPGISHSQLDPLPDFKRNMDMARPVTKGLFVSVRNQLVGNDGKGNGLRAGKQYSSDSVDRRVPLAGRDGVCCSLLNSAARR
jgi:hypothetical protein